MKKPTMDAQYFSEIKSKKEKKPPKMSKKLLKARRKEHMKISNTLAGKPVRSKLLND